jgi:hypothetical protein
MLAREQRVPHPALPAVQAYADFRRFGVLPRAGGTFDQPAGLLEEMRVVHAIVTRAEQPKRKRGRRGSRKASS